MSFDQLFKKLAVEYIVEAPTPAAAPAPVPDASAAPAPDMGGAPSPDAAPPAPQTPPKPFDKSYQDLAKVLYKALRLNFEELPTEEQDRITSIVPEGEESLDSDQRGVALFDAVDKLIKANELPQTEEE